MCKTCEWQEYLQICEDIVMLSENPDKLSEIAEQIEIEQHVTPVQKKQIRREQRKCEV